MCHYLLTDAFLYRHAYSHFIILHALAIKHLYKPTRCSFVIASFYLTVINSADDDLQQCKSIKFYHALAAINYSRPLNLHYFLVGLNRLYMATPTDQSHATFGLLPAPTSWRDTYNQYPRNNAVIPSIILSCITEVYTYT